MSNDEGRVDDDDLQAYVDGRLDPGRATEIEVYLSHHPETAERLRSYKKVRQELKHRLWGEREQYIPERLRIIVIAARWRRAVLPR